MHNDNIVDIVLSDLPNYENVIDIIDGSTKNVVLHYISQDSSILHSYIYGDAQWVQFTYHNFDYSSCSLPLDVNNDGIYDLILFKVTSSGLTFRIINGSTSLLIYQSPVYANCQYLTTLDVDGDSYTEICLTGQKIYIISTPSHTVSINNNTKQVPEFEIKQNYPNPFNPNTTIEFSLTKSCNVKLVVYDILGKEMNILIDDKKNEGVCKVDFNGANLSSGTYFYQLIIDGIPETKKMILLK